MSIHPTAIVETQTLGAGCSVSEHASLGADVTLAEEVHVGAGARVLGLVRVDRGARIGPNAVVGVSDAAQASDVIWVGREARVEASATVLPGVAIGRGAVVEAGSVVDTDVPAHAVVRGGPARIVGYVDTLPEPTVPEVDPSRVVTKTSTGVPGVVLYPVTTARDLRGSLAAAEFGDLPFVPQRLFAVYGVPNESVRGAHAHRTCGQLLFCMSGEVSCVADDGTNRQEFRLSGPEVGLYLPPMVWGMQYRYTRDAVLVVLAQFAYDLDDYIRDYEEFLELAAANGSG